MLNRSTSLGYFDVLPEHLWGEVYRHLGADAASKMAFLRTHPRLTASPWVRGQFTRLTVQLPEAVVAASAVQPPVSTAAAMAGSPSRPAPPPEAGATDAAVAAAAAAAAAAVGSAAAVEAPAMVTPEGCAPAVATGAAEPCEGPHAPPPPPPPLCERPHVPPPLPPLCEGPHAPPPLPPPAWMAWLPAVPQVGPIRQLHIQGSRTKAQLSSEEDEEDTLALEHSFQQLLQHGSAGLESDGPSLLQLLQPQQHSHRRMLSGLWAVRFEGCKVPSLDTAHCVGAALHAHCTGLRHLEWDGYGVWDPLIEGLLGRDPPLPLTQLELAGIDRLGGPNVGAILGLKGLQHLSLPDTCLPFLAGLASPTLTHLHFSTGSQKASMHSGEGSSAAMASTLQGCPHLQALRLSCPWGDIMSWSSHSLVHLSCEAVAARYFRDLLLADLPALRVLQVEGELTVLGIFSVSEAGALAEALERRLGRLSPQALILNIGAIKVDALRALGFPCISAHALLRALTPLSVRPEQAKVGRLAWSGVAFVSAAEEAQLSALF